MASNNEFVPHAESKVNGPSDINCPDFDQVPIAAYGHDSNSTDDRFEPPNNVVELKPKRAPKGTAKKAPAVIENPMLSIARANVRKIDFNADSWQGKFTNEAKVIAREVVHGRVDTAQYTSQLTDAVAASMGSDQFEAIADEVDLYLSRALDIEQEASDEIASRAASDVAAALADQPDWLPNSFHLFKDELYFCPSFDGVFDPSGAKKICSAFSVTATCSGVSFGRVISVADGRELMIPNGTGEGRASDLSELVAKVGIEMSDDADRHTNLLRLIKNSNPSRKIIIVPVGGWVGGRSGPHEIFVGPSESYGKIPPGTEYRIAGASADHAFLAGGTYENWQRDVAAKCVGNSVHTFAMSIGFAAPFARSIKNLTGMFHIFGSSSSGKTTSQLVAGSAWGNDPSGEGYVKSWKGTALATTHLSATYSDIFMNRGELAEVKSSDLSDLIYALADGESKEKMGISASGVILVPKTRYGHLRVCPEFIVSNSAALQRVAPSAGSSQG